MENCNELTKCLCCDGDNLRTILDLGNQTPANNYNVTQKFPLRLMVCMDCSHAQLSHSVNPEILFKDYPYMSGVSKTMKDYYKLFAKNITELTNKLYGWTGKNTSVYEIACNDGSQLDAFKELGYQTFGIDPAKNLTPIAHEKGHNVECDFFPNKWPGLYDVIVAQNVLAHTPDPYAMLMAAQKMMVNNSLLCIQTSQAKMVENHQFDTIYHEHISFFNLRSFSKLVNRCNMEIVKHEFIEGIHGGSDLFILKKVPEISIMDYSDFQNRSYKFADEFNRVVTNLQKENRVVCYGAAAKMINLIRFTGIKPDAIYDDTPTKIGKLIGLRNVKPGAELAQLNKGDVIIPVWNFYDELKEKIEAAHPGKFRFLKYIPQIIVE